MKHLLAAILFFIGTAESAVAQKDALNHEMILVEGGTFQMGSNAGEPDEKPVHSVTLSSFNIGKFEVTQAQWRRVMANSPSSYEDCDNCPVEKVSWNEVQDFIQKLNSSTGYNYRLPTEAEWEYAAKGGKMSQGFVYSGSNDINSIGWYSENHDDVETFLVGSKHQNELGIFDMTGNVSEWCSDWYGNYTNIKEANPKGVSLGQYKVLRGGCWYDEALKCRIEKRFGYMSEYGDSGYGFRLVLPIGDKSKSENQAEVIEVNEDPLTYVEQDAEYPGGTSALFKFISENLVYPEDAVENEIEGRIYVKFVVDVDGTAKEFEIEQGLTGGQSLERAALDVCKKFPRFRPAMQSGKAVRSYYRLPINFQL